MSETRIPWWLVVLLVIGVASLAIWRSPYWKTQIRWGAGGLALVYLTLLLFATGGLPQAQTSSGSQLADTLLLVFGGLGATAAVLFLGRSSPRGQLLWFALVSLSNAGLCLIVNSRDLACVLGVVSVIALIRCWMLRDRTSFRFEDYLPVTGEGESLYVAGLSAAVGLLLAVTLIGTCYYATHAETARATATRRHSALPARARISSVLSEQRDNEQVEAGILAAFGQRADVGMLLMALTFLWLGSTMAVERMEQNAQGS